MKARLSVSEGSLALFGYLRVTTILFNYLICSALSVVFCYAKKVLPLPQNNTTMKPTIFEIVLMVIIGAISVPLIIYIILATLSTAHYLFTELFVKPFHKSPK
nr:MAG TPA: hypothetical protein [Caudoviricetes sp.]